MTQDLSPKSSLLSRAAKLEPRPKHEASAPSVTSPRHRGTAEVGELPARAVAEQDTGGDVPDPPAPIGPCAAALPRAASPVAVRSPIVVRKMAGGAMHLGPEAARLYTPAEAVGLAREILRLFS